MSLGLCATKLPVAWEERTDHPLVPATGQAPVLTRLERPGPELARLEQEFLAYSIFTFDGCARCAIMSVAVHVAILCTHVSLCSDVQDVSLCNDVPICSCLDPRARIFDV